MAELTIEVDDQGNIGTLPEPLQKFFDKGFKDAFKKGAAKVEAELAGKIADPAERERLKALEDENARFREAEAIREKKWDEALKAQEARLTKIAAEKDEHLTAKEAEIAKRDTRLRSMLGAEIRAAAVAAGARDESIPELVKLLGADLDLDAELAPFVKGEDGKPRADKDGKPVSIEGFVTEYLAGHPHHLKGGRSTPGRAPGGATFRQTPASASDMAHEDALSAVAENPSTRTLATAVRSIRQRRA